VPSPIQPRLDNAALSELLSLEAREEHDHRRRALERASKAAWTWTVEAADVVADGKNLTELPTVGPWVAAKIEAWLEHPPPVPDVDETRRGFVTYAWVRRILDGEPAWEALPHGDLQTHSTDSDGKLPLEEMADAARARGRTFVAATDHSKSLTIAHGQDEDDLLAQGRRIDALNGALAAHGEGFRVLRSIEMDVFEDGSGDMDPAALRSLDLVLGAFHSKLRIPDDQTERYLATLRNPAIHVLAHPRGRMFGRRSGIRADLRRVFAEAASTGKALEIDANARRQDLDLDSVRLAVAEGVPWFSIGSDAHDARELDFLPIGLAIAAAGGVARERILNYLAVDAVTAWAAELTAR
jgi:histidinol phosphatase-like PHP family hydrolase